MQTPFRTLACGLAAVCFSTWFGRLIPVPKEDDYWILDVDERYQEAIVGTPDRKYMWTLARTSAIPEARYAALVSKARVFGFNVTGPHIVPIANRLRSEHSAIYEHRDAVLLALASQADWACGLTLNPPDLLVLDMTAIVAGRVIVNAAIGELSKERETGFWSFFFGAVAYTALLLTLSHFEQGAHS